MKANEVRAFDVTNDDGSLRHGFVIENQGTGLPWVALMLSVDRNGVWPLGWYASPNNAIEAIMEKEDQRLVDKK